MSDGASGPASFLAIPLFAPSAPTNSFEGFRVIDIYSFNVGDVGAAAVGAFDALSGAACADADFASDAEESRIRSRIFWIRATSSGVLNSLITRAAKSPLLIKQPISHTEEMLPAHLFIRIHRSFIVSLEKVTAYTRQGVEIGGIELPVGKLYRHRLKKLA